MTTRTTRVLRCGVREAKARLSSLLKEVQSGGEVLITDRGRPVARVVPVQAEDLTVEEWLADLERRGWIEGPTAEGSEPRSPLPGVPEGLAQRVLREQRESR